MNSTIVPPIPAPHAGGHPGLPADAPAAARTVFSLMRRLGHGPLAVQLPDGGGMREFGHQAEGTTHAAVTLNNWNVCAAALKSGDIGFAETYIAGDWHTS